jgi:hypothetical protein
MSLKLYRPTPDGGMEPSPVVARDYRIRLRSRRWRAAPLDDSEAHKTDPRIAVAAIVGLSAFTFMVLVLGYVSGFWG